jgi:hypothetical protein
VTFTEPVTLAPDAITLLCSITGPVAVTVTGGPTTFTVDPATSLADTESCTLTVAATGVSDQDSNDPPDQPDHRLLHHPSPWPTCAWPPP